MTKEEAFAHQQEISKYFNLGWWYGTECKKCCGVFPKFIDSDGMYDMCRYECEVCGKTTDWSDMTWQAAEKWNNGEFIDGQMRLF